MQADRNTEDLLKSAFQHHRAGRVREAEAIYRRVLAVNADQPDALHGLGMLARQAGHTDVALGLIGRAVQMRPTVPQYQHNYGETLLALGKPEQAALAFRSAAQLPGGTPESHVALGVALLRLGRFEQAAEALRLALALGVDRAQVYQHLAAALFEARQYPQAEDACRRGLERGGASAELYQTLGEALGKQNRVDEALAVFRKAIEIQPAYPPPYNGTGVALATQGRFDEAEAHFRHALALKPDYPQAHFNLGMTYLRQRRYEPALECLRRAVELAPQYREARGQLIEALDRCGRRPEAVAELQAFARLHPGDAQIEFALAAMSGREAPPQPPASTVASLFDDYAEVFDQHLSENLRYRAPQVLFEALTKAGLPARADVIDLGCGTGLCGRLLRPAAASLSGVDLSPAMVDKARERGIYDHLEVGDLTTVLRSHPGSYQVVVAADVFVYLGDLSDAFAAAFAAIRPGGLFGFTVEALDDGTYALCPSRRYAHSESYVRDVAERTGFEVVTLDRAALRTEKQQDVGGLVTVLRKPAGARP